MFLKVPSTPAASDSYLSGFVSVRNSDAIRSIWDVVVWLIFVDVLQKKEKRKKGCNRICWNVIERD